jgi:hypothetical protein
MPRLGLADQTPPLDLLHLAQAFVPVSAIFLRSGRFPPLYAPTRSTGRWIRAAAQ